MKILITGNAGSGKSTLSKQLGEKLGIPVFSLDQVVWKSGWRKPSPVERKQKLDTLLNKSEWIIDGVATDVLREAGTVIFLDFPRRVCFPRVIKRNWRYLFKSRPELPDNCPEILIIPRLFQIIWNFPKNIRPGILKAKSDSSKKFIHVRSKQDVVAVLNELED